eukprot:3403058-Pyramimonas_sp.AAC.1
MPCAELFKVSHHARHVAQLLLRVKLGTVHQLHLVRADIYYSPPFTSSHSLTNLCYIETTAH